MVRDVAEVGVSTASSLHRRLPPSAKNTEGWGTLFYVLFRAHDSEWMGHPAGSAIPPTKGQTLEEPRSIMSPLEKLAWRIVPEGIGVAGGGLSASPSPIR